MRHRLATNDDLDLLARWNQQLIRDEGHRNRMTLPQLRQRMGDWLSGDYKAVIFESGGQPAAYALYRQGEAEIHLRQFFVRPECRRQGVGRAAIAILRQHVWPRDGRLTVEVLTANIAAAAFWRAVGYRDYCLTLEILPPARD